MDGFKKWNRKGRKNKSELETLQAENERLGAENEQISLVCECGKRITLPKPYDKMPLDYVSEFEALKAENAALKARVERSGERL